jgi:hypothetical protein
MDNVTNGIMTVFFEFGTFTVTVNEVTDEKVSECVEALRNFSCGNLLGVELFLNQ